MLSRPTCSVVIPTYNGLPLLRTCLASIARHRPPGIAIEVIVADDASTDATASWLAETHPDCRLVALDRNSGFCVAANAGVAAARGEFIQLLNNDTEVTAGWIEAGLAPFADPTVGSVAPLVLLRSDPSVVDSAGDSYALIGWPFKRGHLQPAVDWESHPSDLVLGASASSAFYRADALRKVGVFDPSFGSYYEDVDLAFRLRWAGYRCVFTPRSKVLHDVSATYDHGSPTLHRRLSRNGEFLFWTNLPAPWLVAALVPHLGFTLAQGIRRGRLRSTLHGKLDALREFRTLGVRRRARSDLSRTAIARPHFPLKVAALADLRNHLSRRRRNAAAAGDGLRKVEEPLDQGGM